VRAFVTGARGFVGSHLVPRLEQRGFEVVATDRELDVADALRVEDAVRRAKPDLLIHLAALSSVAASWREPELTYRVNFLGARAVLEAVARAAPRARLLLIGSADQYGSLAPGAAPLDEAAPLRPHSPYARTKTAADLLGAAWAQRGLDVVRVRAFNHTGAGQSEEFVLSSFARQAVEIAMGRREPRLRVGNLDSVRDFLDVEDVVEAYQLLSETSVPAGVYNVASGLGVRIGDALDEILGLAGVQPSIESDPERMRPRDQLVGDAARLRSACGWKPRVRFSETLARLVEDWRQRVSAS
jgi:GDP-4-dehydro-6-deoxy-D-mannose reductase